MTLRIRGQRTVLRVVSHDDLDLLAGWFSDPEVYRWWDGYPKPTEEVAAQYLGGRRPQVESFIIELAEDASGDGAIAGTLHDGDTRAGGEPIGYLQSWHGTERTGVLV